MIFKFLCLLCAVYGASGLSRCKRSDGVCIGRKFTDIIQNPKEHVKWNIPNLNPYKSEQTFPWRFKLPIVPISFSVEVDNIRIYGLNKLKIKEISGKGVDQPFTKISVKSFAPSLKMTLDVKVKGTVAVFNYDTDGSATATSNNAEIDMTINNKIVRRGGKDYIKIQNVESQQSSFGDFEMESKGNNINGLVNNLIDSAINTFWQVIVEAAKPLFLNKYFGEMMTSILSPIFDRIAIQDFAEE